MKKTTTLLAHIILFSSIIFNGVIIAQCTIEIPPEEFYIEGTDINPGDVICLLAGDKDYIQFKEIKGTAANPITIINSGGPVVIDTDHFYGVKFNNCEHIIFSGNGEPGVDYGIQIKRVGNGAGMSVDNMSTNVEIEYIEVSWTSIGGIYAKTEPYQGDCNDMVTRDKFTMYDLKIHDCYIHDVADEGFYIGSSKYTGQTMYECDDVVVLPHVIEGVQIYNNIVENSGWDGIQVSSAPSTNPFDCNIYNNVIINDSEEEYPYQMSGILIGGGAKCDCYNNKIIDGKGDGIDILGLGDMKIYNNLIVRAGRSFMSEAKHGIWVGEVVTTPGSVFEIYNNTIISPNSAGIKYANLEATKVYIKNNLITNPGLLNTSPNDAYLNIDPNVNQQKVEYSNNFNVENNSIPKFINSNADNYDLKPSSFAVNYGTSLTNQGITFDIENRARPFHTYFDAGAYESHDPSAGIGESKLDIGNPYPIPAKDYLVIPIGSVSKNALTITISSMHGNLIYQQVLQKHEVNNEIYLNLKNIDSGSYLVNIASTNHSLNKPIIIVK